MEDKLICVIGAGAAGLASVRHLKSIENFKVTAFEQGDSIGGLWHYHSEIGDHVYNAMYQNLRINVPKEIMGFSWDLPIPNKDDNSFVGHQQIYQYLQDYAHQFDLLRHIKFQTRVVSVKKIETNDKSELGPQWLVTVQNMKTLTTQTIKFDVVVVCNGHDSKPSWPTIENLEKFEGLVMHSRDYREPDLFKNKRVIVMGCGPSGIDIALDIAPVASKVILSIRNPPFSGQLPGQIEQTCCVKSALSSSFVMEDGQECPADILLLCTGYKFDYPFMDESCGLWVEHNGKEVRPLYRHLIHTKYPTLCFPCIPYRGISFYQTELQLRYYTKVLTGEVKLPTEPEMNFDYDQDKMKRREMGLKEDHSHCLGPLQWDYYLSFAKDAGFLNELKPVVRKVYEAYFTRRVNCPAVYREDKIKIIDENSFDFYCAGANI